jgi:hypothetical protein
MEQLDVTETGALENAFAMRCRDPPTRHDDQLRCLAAGPGP